MSKARENIEEELGIEPQAFEALERDFQEVLQELAGEASFEKFRKEYEKLHRALKTSHENEKRLIKKCRELNNEIVENASKIQHALKLTQEDTNTINLLKNEIDKTYKMLEVSKDREEKNKQRIEHLSSEINQLRHFIDQGNSMATGQNNTVNDLLRDLENVTAEKNTIQMKLDEIKKDAIAESNHVKQLKSENENLLLELSVQKKNYQEIEERVEKDEARRQKIQEEMDAVKKNLEATQKEKEKTEGEKNSLNKKITSLEESNKKKDNERQKIESEIRRLEGTTQQLKLENTSLENECKGQYMKAQEGAVDNQKLTNEINALRTENAHLKRQIDKHSKHLKMLESQKKEAERLKDIAKNSIYQLEREIEETKKIAKEDKKVVDTMKNERDLLMKDIHKADKNNRDQGEKLLKEEKDHQDKRNEIHALRKDIERLNRKISQLEKEKEKYGINAAQANAKYFHSLEEIKLKDNLISEFQKKNIETEAKLKQQQNLYEAVRSDRNLYSKNLTETQDEIAEIKRRYKIVTHQISQLKEEIDAKEAALAKEHFDLAQKEKDIEENKKKIETLSTSIATKDNSIKNFVNEISKLGYIIKESEQQRKKLKEEYETVVSERDILGTQLIRRNDELALLYEKIRIQQSTLAKGETQYRERLNEIELLKNRIADILRELNLYRNRAIKIPELKSEIHSLQKELIDEKLKVKGLSEELENPMNVHRWRKLEGTDSDTYEMLTKIQTLQKRLIAKTEECVEKDVIVQQKEKNLNELREIMKRQPGIEEAKMISTYQQNIKQKTRQLKSMAAELNMYQAQVNEYKYEIERLTRELQEVKRKYFELKKREQIAREQVEREQKAMTMQINLPDKRYTGGGFNLAV